MKLSTNLITLRTTTLITVALITSTFSLGILTQSASAKSYDWFDQARAYVADKKGSSSNSTQVKLIISRGDAEINRRLQTLAHLNNLIDSATHLTSANKTALKNEVNSTLNGLNTLKAKLDSETTVAGAKADAQSIFTEYRVYALVVPKIHLIKMADDIQATDTKLTTIAGKLQTRIDTAKSAGKDTADLEKQLTDLTAQIAAAQNIAGNVETKVINLQPSDYNTDHKLLAGYSAQLKNARADNQTAYNDAKNIVNTLKTL